PVRGRAGDEAVVDRCAEDPALEVVVRKTLGARVELLGDPGVVLHALVVLDLVRLCVGVVPNLLQLAINGVAARQLLPEFSEAHLSLLPGTGMLLGMPTDASQRCVRIPEVRLL